MPHATPMFSIAFYSRKKAVDAIDKAEKTFLKSFFGTFLCIIADAHLGLSDHVVQNNSYLFSKCYTTYLSG